MKLSPEQKQMVEDNIKLAFFTANKFKTQVREENIMEYQELISVAFEGLVTAALNHNSSRSSKFSTYAVHIIKYFILNEIYSYRKQSQVQQTLFHSFVDLADIIESDISPDINSKLQLIIQNLRDFKGTQREKAAVITFVRNPSLPQAEIAQKTGVSQKTVSTAIYKFKKRLQEAI